MHARFGNTRVTLPRRCQERVECGLEIALLGDAAFERPDLIGAPEAVADVEFERRIRAGVPQRDRAGLPESLRRSPAYSAIV